MGLNSVHSRHSLTALEGPQEDNVDRLGYLEHHGSLRGEGAMTK